MGWRFGHHDRWLGVGFSGTISLGRKRDYAHFKDGSIIHGCVASHLSLMMGKRWFSEKSEAPLWFAHFHAMVWPSYIVVVPAVSTSATLSVTAIDGAALKVEIQVVVGVGSWSNGYLVHLKDPCLARSVIEVQSDTMDLSRIYRDGVYEYWFCQPYFSFFIISFCQGSHFDFCPVAFSGISQLPSYVAIKEKLKWRSSQDDHIWKFFGGQPLEDKQEIAEVQNDKDEPNSSGNGIEDDDPVEADDLAEAHPHDE
ncbi:hypothetical protein V6N13_095640 [Hibiscus sabdariffa]